MDKQTLKALQSILREAHPGIFHEDANYAEAWDRAMSWMAVYEQEISE